MSKEDLMRKCNLNRQWKKKKKKKKNNGFFKFIPEDSLYTRKNTDFMKPKLFYGEMHKNAPINRKTKIETVTFNG